MSYSRLVLKAVQLEGGSTTVKLEPEFWDMLKEISIKEKKGISQIIAEIDLERGDMCLRASAIRVYILGYLRHAAASELMTLASVPIAVIPALRLDAVIPALRLDAAIPALRLDAAIPAVRLDAAIPALRLDAVIPALRLDAAIPALRLDAAIPALCLDAAIPAVRLDAVIPALCLDVAIPVLRLDAVIPAVSLEGTPARLTARAGEQTAGSGATGFCVGPPGTPVVTTQLPLLNLLGDASLLPAVLTIAPTSLRPSASLGGFRRAKRGPGGV